VSLSDAAYKGNSVAQTVTLSTSQAAPTTLTLPGALTITAASATPVAATHGVAHATATRTLASTGASTTVPLVGLAVLTLAGVARRRRA
jgi:MYXO-CTERM domain-containing protein